jgi:hypothetical protein
MKKIILYWLLAGCLAGCDAAEPRTLADAAAPRVGPGLTVQDGQFFKDGQPFHGIGVNYYSAFYRKLGIEGGPIKLEDRSYLEGFKVLQAHEIPFIRFNLSGYWPNEVAVYQQDPEAFLIALDQFVADAEAHDIGLIPCFFWLFATVPDLVGEPVNQWGNPESQTHAYMNRFTRDVVERIKDSPAIFGWEFGNEWVLYADLPDPEQGRGDVVPHFGTPETRTADDKLFRQDLYVAYAAFVETVRELDTKRPIFTGDTLPRVSAHHNETELSWGMDTPEEWTSIFRQDNAAMDTLSAHVYYYELSGETQHFGVKGYDPNEVVALMMQAAEESRKPLWIGEFGPANADKTEDVERTQFIEMLDILLDNEVPLAALWNYDFEHVDQTRWNITEANHRAYMLDALQQANRELKQ